MPPAFDAASWPALQRARRTVVVVDMVESVRLIEAHEEDTVRRWQQFVAEVNTQLLPAQQGRLVKSLGDGLLCEFAAVRPAVHSALAMQRLATRLNDGYPDEQAIHLRIGAHTADVIVDALDVYGSGVNLAARLAGVSDSTGCVVSAEVRDELTDGLDADIEDLGACYLKHLPEPVHAYRLCEPGVGHAVHELDAYTELRPALAVIPFRARGDVAEHAVLGDVLADELIAALSQSARLRVISRLSTSAFRDRASPLASIGTSLRVRYVLSGAYLVNGANVRLAVELADSVTEESLWACTVSASIDSILAGDDAMVPQIVATVADTIIAQELRRCATAPLPTLQSCTLLLGATTLMHRATAREFDRAGEALEHLAQRHRRQPQAHAWLGKWHVLRVVQGWTADRARETALAQASVQRALDADPSCSLALAFAGLIEAYLRKDTDEADRHYVAAIASNPNESLAWLFRSTLHSYRDEGALAAAAAEHALRLSPLDPLRYFFDSLAATAVLSSGDYPRAIELARRSLKANRTHTSTYRALAIAQALHGQLEGACATVAGLRQLEPQLTVRGFVERYPGRIASQVDLYAEALRAAGLPD